MGIVPSAVETSSAFSVVVVFLSLSNVLIINLLRHSCLFQRRNLFAFLRIILSLVKRENTIIGMLWGNAFVLQLTRFFFFWFFWRKAAAPNQSF